MKLIPYKKATNPALAADLRIRAATELNMHFFQPTALN
jgi:hypothetical protein